MKTQITPQQVDKIRSWFLDPRLEGHGYILQWSSCEIGNPRPDLLTEALNDKGEPHGAPHWAYVGKPKVLQPSDIEVTTKTPVLLPPEWSPKCKYCENGKRKVAEIAKVREVSIQTMLETMQKENAEIPGVRWKLDPLNHTFECWSCNGTGHERMHITARAKREYWGGYTVSKAGQTKAKTTIQKLAKHYNIPASSIQWDWEHAWFGLVELKFYTEVITPFVLEVPAETAGIPG